jgi:CRISPR-associated endonuclease Csn1
MANLQVCGGLELGLDLGSNSLGWALVRVVDGVPVAIVDCGVRIFEAGMEEDIAAGKGESRGAIRRTKHAQRRRIDRRRRRKVKIIHQLQRMGLLPSGKADEVIPALDRQILAEHSEQFVAKGRVNLANLLPYWLRKEALDRKLDPFEIGRVLYHLSQRRGFLSNRRTPKKPDEKDGTVQASISELQEAISAAGARTLGEYLASIDPHTRRLRQRWTHRGMYLDEFRRIWNAQAGYYPQIFTSENQRRLAKAVFHQRPLKSGKSLVGRCELEPNCRRAAYSLLEAQRFRYLQPLNNCKIVVEDTGEIRDFTPEEHRTLVDELEKGDLTFAQAKKLLGLKTKTVTFRLEAGGEKRFIGNRINQKIAKAIGDVWYSYPSEKREAMIMDLRQFREEAALIRRAIEVWGLDVESARAFARVELEPGYASLSRRAIRKLLPLLEARLPYATARKQVYPDHLSSHEEFELLPAVLSQSDVRNPVVLRSLTELRKVVNSLIRKYGKPQSIRIELAREMKQGQRERQRRIHTMRENEARRKAAAEEIRQETGIERPSDDDILKVQLAKECNWICPYTGRSISMNTLVGKAPQFDVEHIIPFSRSLDDSFLNKTLCYHEENRHRKQNRLPHEVYYATEQWDTILGAVSRFSGLCRSEKLRRFTMTAQEWEQENGGFVARQLNDTRYACKFARAYLGLLYGGYWDAEGRQRVFAVTGQVTAIVRNMWDLNGILGDGGTKERIDHRHHAVDAVAIALTMPRLIQDLADHALPWYERRRYRGRFRQLGVPWETFHADLEKAIGGIVVSHRVEHRVNGALHKEHNYSAVGGGKSVIFHLRRSLGELKASEVERIVDPRVKAAVQAKLRELRTTDPTKAFADSARHPVLVSRAGHETPIHAVRIRVRKNPVSIGKRHPKYCTPDSNHHLEILGVLDRDGRVVTWDAKVVSTYEAMQRLRKKLPIIQLDHGPDRQLLLTICPGDTIRLTNPGTLPELLRVRTVSQSKSGRIEVAGVALSEARKVADAKKAGEWHRIRSMRDLQRLQPSVVTVLPDGTLQAPGR